MVEKGLIEWVKKELEQYPESQVRDYMIKRGINAREIDEALIMAKRDIPSTPNSRVRREQNESIKNEPNYPADKPVEDNTKRDRLLQNKTTENMNSHVENKYEKENLIDRNLPEIKNVFKKYKIDEYIKKIRYDKKILIGILAVLVIFLLLSIDIPNEYSHEIDNGKESDNNIDYDNDYQTEDTGTCFDMMCFENKFNSCTQGTLNIRVSENETLKHEITGLKGRLCEVKTTAVTHPIDDVAGKTMYCKLDMKDNFTSAFNSDDKLCKGELYLLMQNEPEDKTTKNETEKNETIIEVDIEIKHETTFKGEEIELINYTIEYKKGPLFFYMIQGYSKGISDPSDIKAISSAYRSYKDSETLNFIYPERNIVLEEEGNYSFYLYVYNCSEIEDEFQRGCSSVPKNSIINSTEPIIFISENILSERPVLTSCKTDLDCNNCTGCRTGKEKCVSRSVPENRTIEYVCVECVPGYNLCKEGYICILNECVLNED